MALNGPLTKVDGGRRGDNRERSLSPWKKRIWTGDAVTARRDATGTGNPVKVSARTGKESRVLFAGSIPVPEHPLVLALRPFAAGLKRKQPLQGR
jgi:hypothetical protein